jgi:cytochrome b pre-mRNA-processing protein 3
MLQSLRNKRARRDLADRLYTSLVQRARSPVFFEQLGVPDTIDGRLDVLILHAWLALARLNAPETRDLAQFLTDRLFAGFEEALRELGASDTGVSRRVKQIADAFYGRIDAYRRAQSEDALAGAVLRNIYREYEAARDNASVLARYAFEARLRLAASDPQQGALDFGPGLAMVQR